MPSKTACTVFGRDGTLVDTSQGELQQESAGDAAIAASRMQLFAAEAWKVHAHECMVLVMLVGSGWLSLRYGCALDLTRSLHKVGEMAHVYQQRLLRVGFAWFCPTADFTFLCWPQAFALLGGPVISA